MVKLLALLLGIAWGQTGQVGTDHFGGLNDTDSPATLQPYESPSLLNVESNVTGTAVKKRLGYSKEADLSISTASVTGSHSYIDSNGSQIIIVCQDRNCAKSTNGGSFSVFYSSTAAGITRWSFVDINGKVFGANDKNDPVFQCCDGNTVSFPATIPAGTILELTKDRLVVTGTVANPNRVAYSQSGVYTNFTSGPQTSDPWTDDFGTPGDKNTGLKYDRGRLYIFKRQSITACILADQYSTQCFPINNTIGTSDPASIVSAPDGIYFRSQDKTFWKLSDSGLELISKKISNFISSQTATTSGVNSNIQTSQSDWQAGTISQALGNTWNTDLIPGSILPSTWSITESTQSQWSLGTFNQISTMVVPGSLTLQIETASFTNGGFESGNLNNWSFALGSSWLVDSATHTTVCIGTYTAIIPCVGIATTLKVEVLKPDDTLVSSRSFINDGLLACSSQTLPALFDQQIKVKVTENTSGNAIQSNNFLGGRKVGFKVSQTGTGNNCSAPNISTRFDMVEPTGYVSSGTFVSQEFDTNFSTPVFGLANSSWTIFGVSSVTFYSKSATTSGGSYDEVSMSTNTKISSAVRRFLKYKIGFNTSTSTQTPVVGATTLNAATTGQFYTQCIQPSASILSWGTFSCAEQKSGGGSLTYYARSDKGGCQFLSTGTWTAQTNNSSLTISTGLAVQIRFDSILGSATNQAQVDACTLYWNNTSGAQPIWGVYDGIKNAIYWTTTAGGSTTNNRLLKYDLNLLQWYPFDIGATALKIINSYVYFGSPTVGKWYKYGSSGVTSDDGSSINSYWTSKDFQGSSPFQESSWLLSSAVLRNQISGTITGLITTSHNDQDSYTINIGTTSAIGYARSIHAVKRMSPSSFANIQFSDNSANKQWEVVGTKLDFFTLPSQPMNP